jgi:hypothetical protein
VPPDFLQQLPISDEERSKLSKLGARSPAALLSMRKASREAFDNYIGKDRADTIAEELTKLLTPGDVEALNQPPNPRGKLGARLGPAPPFRK